jgi:two-component system LytT family sensor kinase
VRRFAIVWGAWTIVGLFTAASTYARILTGEINPMPGWFWINVSTIPLWALMTPVILWLARSAFSVPRAIVHHAVGIAIMLALDGALSWILFHQFLGRPEETYWQHVWKWSFADVLFYGGTIAVERALRYHRLYIDRRVRASELEMQLTRAQLQALQMQIRPHFLFNTLNSIAGLVRLGDHAAAIEMLAGLGDLLRLLLHSDGAQVVPIERELELAERYLRIEQVRFADQLRVEIVVEPGLEGALVPILILQPLVENAIRHGIASAATTRTLTIRCERHGNTLHVAVSNSTDPDRRCDVAGEGIGLTNTRARLEGLYGAAHRFELLHTAAGTSAVLEIPLSGLT